MLRLKRLPKSPSLKKQLEGGHRFNTRILDWIAIGFVQPAQFHIPALIGDRPKPAADAISPPIHGILSR
jgi:hypothetical protein